VKEGFGLAFLEAWMANRMLFGRLLPEICRDFTDRGMVLDHLYREISIPIHLFDRELFFKKWRKCYGERLRLYGLEPDRPGELTYLNQIRESGYVDFGVLSEDLQRQVILGIGESNLHKEELLGLNPSLINLRQLTGDADGGSTGSIENPLLREDTVSHNRAIVAREFSSEKNRERLLHVYDCVARVEPVHAIDGNVLLRLFNTPESSNLLLCDLSHDE
jgi:hypothetical protein